MRLSPEYHRLSQIIWDDIFTLRVRGHVGTNSPFAKRERDEITTSLCSVIRSLSRDRGNNTIWVYSNDYASTDLLLDKSYSQIQILYKKTSNRRIDSDEFEFKLNDFLKEIYKSKKINDMSVDLKWETDPDEEQLKYFFKIKDLSEYKHFVYSDRFIKNINKLLDGS